MNQYFVHLINQGALILDQNAVNNIISIGLYQNSLHLSGHMWIQLFENTDSNQAQPKIVSLCITFMQIQ